jgi:hypothetical protein
MALAGIIVGWVCTAIAVLGVAAFVTILFMSPDTY